MRDIILALMMWVVTTCTYISYLPQIIKMVKTKRAEDLSITSWFLWFLSSVCNTVYSFVLWRKELIIASVSELVLVTITLILTLILHEKEKTISIRGIQFNEKDDIDLLIAIVDSPRTNPEILENIAKNCTDEIILARLEKKTTIPSEIRGLAAAQISNLYYDRLKRVPYVSGDWTIQKNGSKDD